MIHFLAETGSTNAELIARLRDGALVAEGDWLVADRQLAGKGRLGRVWFDGTGNFMGSTCVRIGPGDPAPSTLALLTGLALHEAVSMRIVPPARAELKWPNDVMVGRAKLAGILLEREGDNVVVGIGVNLARAPDIDGRETIALSAFGPTPDRNAFTEDLARAFALELGRWRTYGLEPLLRRWIAAAHTLDTPLTVNDAGAGALTGTFAGLSADGALQLRLGDGTTRTIHAGEVTFARD